MAIMHVGSARYAPTAGVVALADAVGADRRAKEIYFLFYISPETRISDGRRRKARLMNIQEQRSPELAQDEREKEREK